MRKNLQKMATSVAQSGIETAGEGAFALGRTAWLLGIGIAASAGETGVEVFDALVEKGRHRRRSSKRGGAIPCSPSSPALHSGAWPQLSRRSK